MKILPIVFVLASFAAYGQAPAQLGPYGVLPVNLVGNVAVDTATLGLASFGSTVLTGTPTMAANYTTPTATALCTLFPFLAQAGTINWSYDWWVKNTSSGANTITLVAGSGVTLVGTGTATQNNVRHFKVQFRSCTTPAVQLISLELGAF